MCDYAMLCISYVLRYFSNNKSTWFIQYEMHFIEYIRLQRMFLPYWVNFLMHVYLNRFIVVTVLILVI